MKKSAFVLYSLLGLTLLPLASAVEFETASNQLIDWIKQIFAPFFEALIGTSQFDQYFFARILFLILLYAIVLIALRNVDLFKKNRGVTVVVSAIVAIVSMRYLSETALMQWILVPYGAFATAVLVLLPFIIYLLFLHSAISSSLGRKLGWILFGAVFLGLIVTRLSDLGSFSFENLSITGWVFIIGIIAVILAFLFDKQIQKFFQMHKVGKWKKSADTSEAARLHADYQHLAGVSTPEAKAERERILKRLKEIGSSTPD